MKLLADPNKTRGKIINLLIIITIIIMLAPVPLTFITGNGDFMWLAMLTVTFGLPVLGVLMLLKVGIWVYYTMNNN